MQTLTEIFNQIGFFGKKALGHNDKNSIHSYLPVYDKLFEPYRKGCSLLEIGIAKGMSIKLWDEYFIDSTIIGVDIFKQVKDIPYNNEVVF